MEDEIFGANELTLEELDQLFKSEPEQTTPSADEKTEGQNNTENKSEQPADENKSIDKTQAFAKRLKESTDKARREERDAIAKSLGYESYADLEKQRENKMLEDKGFDPEQLSPVVDEIVKKRMDNDPRMKELEELRKKQVEEFGKRELAEITKLTDGEITSLAQLPKEVIEAWKTKGSLKSAYLAVEGERLINKFKGEQSKGSTSHLKNPSGTTPPASNKRPLTADEKRVWKFFNPGMTDEELNKQMVDN